MKNILSLIILSTFTLVSCSNDKSSTQNEEALLTASPKKGIISSEHEILTALKNKDKITFEDADALYRKYSSDADSNIKNFGFLLMIEKGLIEKGTPEQKKFYINEQLSLDSNMPNLHNFYQLLLSSSDFMSKDEISTSGKEFYEINKQAIATGKWPTEERKKQRSNDLIREYKFFSRYITVNLK